MEQRAGTEAGGDPSSDQNPGLRQVSSSRLLAEEKQESESWSNGTGTGSRSLCSSVRKSQSSEHNKPCPVLSVHLVPNQQSSQDECVEQ